ncbi:hypothetical protein QYN14_26945 (plasmid) [Rhodococcus ruber]|uniref:HEPN domain-containing protein n=1 Tax=Rhodococcus ruber TaxID=1830 RepID=UPI00265B2DB5|nr:HEPN domain-containing protein [Rhodococcus ruber]WKK14794.1 hypothetical protein QYN14_26945 [Rhodococcus ruber]
MGDVRDGTIYGESDSGKAVTLWDAQRGNYTAGVTGNVREEFWHSSWICVGAHIPSAREPTMTRTAIIIDDLYYLTEDGRICPPQWSTAAIEGVDQPHEKQTNGTLLRPYVFPVIGGYRADCAQGETADATYSVNTWATQPFVSPATEKMPGLKLQMMTKRRRSGMVVELRVGAHASIQLPEKAAGSAADFVDRMTPLDNLIRLAMFDTCGVEQITMTTVESGDVSILARVGDVARPDAAHESAAVVFTLADVPLEMYLKTWQRLTGGNQASYAWSVVVGLCGYSSRMVEEYVGQAIAAAEGFHRWCLDGGGDDVTLNRRLKELHHKLDPEVQKRLGIDVEQWAGWAVWARNHVAHGGTKRLRILRDSYQLKVVAESVHLVTYLAALQELQVPIDKVREALLNHPRLKVMAENCAKVNHLGSGSQAGS